MILKSKWLCAVMLPLSLTAWAGDEPGSVPDVNPRVVAKLVQMGEYLRGLPKFQVDAQLSQDVIVGTGQKIKVLGTSRLVIDGKTRMRANLTTDGLSRSFFYNGKKFTQYSPTLKYFTTVDAPATVLETVHAVEKHYGLQLPMEDLFRFGLDEAQIKALTVAAYVGPSTVNGKVCDHLAIRGPGVDWQVWMTRSEKPLPCKLVVTRTDKPSQPEFSADYQWNLDPTMSAAGFTFKPAKGDAEIPFKKIAEQGK